MGEDKNNDRSTRSRLITQYQNHQKPASNSASDLSMSSEAYLDGQKTFKGFLSSSGLSSLSSWGSSSLKDSSFVSLKWVLKYQFSYRGNFAYKLWTVYYEMEMGGVKGHTKGVQVKVFPGEELPNGSHLSSLSQNANETITGEANSNEQKREKISRKEKQGMVTKNDLVEPLRLLASSIFTAVTGWLIRQKPFFVSLTDSIFRACDHFKMKIQRSYPIVLKWLLHFGNILLLLFVFWLDCALRGIDSFVRMGTASFFSVIWCSIFSVLLLSLIVKLYPLGLGAFFGFFIGLTLAILVVAILGIVFLWIYGSFWTTATFIFLGGLAYKLSHERVALLITTVYSVYCAWMYVGWLGLLLALNLSFVSSDVLVYFLKKRINQQSRSSASPEHGAGMQGQPGFFNDEPMQASYSENGPGPSADRSAGVPSTSGADSDLSSEDEVVRLLNCSDHYSVLGLMRYQSIDASLLKREYRKKAMLVHPDKNMGDEKAAEAFKKLQNAYEVLMDSLKRKAYDDELRREELLSIFRRFQTASHKNGRHGFFPSGFARSDADSDDLFGDSRRIACKKCGSFHIWIHTKKQKSRARWCQDCQDFHQAKDGDGWVEQSSQPFLFGLLQKVDAPSAYVCADSRIYDATEWYICQGMRCPPNTHKPSFHVNTSLTSKHSSGKGSNSSQRGGRMPTANMEETMTEEEFFEWLQNAAQSGMFDNFGGHSAPESPSAAKSGNGMKNTTGNSSGSGSSKRKKKGKKQR
ncbi:dnaJ-like protein subfamily C member 14 [Senna tora]|uniref:DnaJ-like protein subfamily C member 14 n=1 Tax=Senna tora TaxID=362788 RepID=A0A834X4M4_9FABA|nr:dnaJ-like protein subfamily C member 14 [Senna tora]